MKSDDSRPHLMFVGFHPSAIGSIDCENNRVTIIVHDYVAKYLDTNVKAKLTDIATIHVPHNMNLEEYMDAMPQIEKAADALIQQYGMPKGFIALYEHVTLPAAILREKYGVAGTSVHTALLCRDKVKMKEVINKKAPDVKCPLFMSIDRHTEPAKIKLFLDQMRGKVVLKPRAQAASEGIYLFNDKDEALLHIEKEGVSDRYEMEEYIAGRLCHFDGVVRKNKLLFYSASYYTTTCFNYVYKKMPIASITMDETEQYEQSKKFTQTILAIVGLEDGVFHLEAFMQSDGTFVFLEVANRFGGAGVVPQMKKIYDVDLIKETIAADINEASCMKKSTEVSHYDFSSAWLYIPISTNESCQIDTVKCSSSP